TRKGLLRKPRLAMRKQLLRPWVSPCTLSIPFGTSATAAHLAVVEVDPNTYQVRVERFIVAEDCGRIVNPMIVDGQVHGGVAQGIGAALFEEVVFNEDGQPVTASLVDYLIPTATE